MVVPVTGHYFPFTVLYKTTLLNITFFVNFYRKISKIKKEIYNIITYSRREVHRYKLDSYKQTIKYIVRFGVEYPFFEINDQMKLFYCGWCLNLALSYQEICVCTDVQKCHLQRN